MTRKITVTVNFERDYDDQFVMRLMEKIQKAAQGSAKQFRKVTVTCQDIGL